MARTWRQALAGTVRPLDGRGTEPHAAGRGASTGTGPEEPKDEDSQGRGPWTRSPDAGTKVGRTRRERLAAHKLGLGPPAAAPWGSCKRDGTEERKGRTNPNHEVERT
jgi:hypothetical protein